ncbi:hypothetical protein M5K25_019112 [Dendrobium thyrsiflorum]|uniref:Uncharacterized protein n=1 Tax=Dendrobium thyrsiflorum TaxID=117978 RepID=A0ABD0UE89_DENTH
MDPSDIIDQALALCELNLPRLGEISGVIACLPRQESRAQSVSGDTTAVVFVSVTPIEACTGLQGYLFEKHNSFPEGTETRTGTYIFVLSCYEKTRTKIAHLRCKRRTKLPPTTLRKACIGSLGSPQTSKIGLKEEPPASLRAPRRISSHRANKSAHGWLFDALQAPKWDL